MSSSTSQLLKCASICIPDKGQDIEYDFYLWEGVLTNSKLQNQTATGDTGLEQASPSTGKSSALRSRKHSHLTSNLLLRIECKRRRLGSACPFLLPVSTIQISLAPCPRQRRTEVQTEARNVPARVASSIWKKISGMRNKHTLPIPPYSPLQKKI